MQNLPPGSGRQLLQLNNPGLYFNLTLNQSVTIPDSEETL